jgi:hypothetical protein
MANAAVGGDHATSSDLHVEARRAGEISAEQDGETAHGEALITQAIENGRLPCATFACPPRMPALCVETL